MNPAGGGSTAGGQKVSPTPGYFSLLAAQHALAPAFALAVAVAAQHAPWPGQQQSPVTQHPATSATWTGAATVWVSAWAAPPSR